MAKVTKAVLSESREPQGAALLTQHFQLSILNMAAPAHFQWLVTSELTDDELVMHTLAGEEWAFEQLARRHTPRVMGIARRFFRSPETVEDIAQETFTRAFFALAGYRQGASFAHWLSKITVNNCYDELRRRKQRGEWLLTDMSEDEHTWLENKLAQTSLSHYSNHDEKMYAAEIAEKLLTRLSPEDRVMLILLHAEECSVQEIADLLGWTQARVKIRAFRARRQMRRLLGQLPLIEQRQRSRLDERCSVDA